MSMNMKWFKRIALSGLLAAALPLGAQAQGVFNLNPINFDGTGQTQDHWVGARLLPNHLNGVTTLKTDGTTVTEIHDFGALTSTKRGNTYNLLGGINLTNMTSTLVSQTDGGVKGVTTSDYEGTFNLGAVNIGGSVPAHADGSSMRGFHTGHADGDSKAFTGTIKAGDFNITNTGTGEAYGATFTGVDAGSIGNQQDIAGNVTFGNMTVAGNSYANAIAVGRVAKGANLTVQSVNVTSNNGTAAGLHINDSGNVSGGNNTAAGGNVVVKDGVTVTGSDAVGLGFNDGGPNGGDNPFDSTENVTLNGMDILATGAAGTATGIKAKGINSAISTGDVNVTATGAAGTATGVNTAEDLGAGANLITGDINATGATAIGINAGTGIATNAKVQTGTITAQGVGVGSKAYGVQIGNTLPNSGIYGYDTTAAKNRTVSLGEINVDADLQAVGIQAYAANAGALNMTIDKNITATATGVNATAAAINASANSSLQLDGTRSELTLLGKAENVNSSSAGISGAGNLTVNAAGNVNVLGDNRMGNNWSSNDANDAHLGILTQGNLNVRLADKAQLATNGISATGNIVIDSPWTAATNDAADARFDIGAVHGANSITIMNQGTQVNGAPGVNANSRTTVSANLADTMLALGVPVPVTVGDRVNVEVYGDVLDVDQNGAGWDKDAVPPTTAVNVNYIGADPTTSSYKNLSVFTDWALTSVDNDGIASNYEVVYRGVRQEAYMNDGFLAALMIHQRNAVFNAARDHMISFGGNRGYRGQICDPCAPISDCDPCEPACDDVACDPCDPCGDGSLFGGGKSRHGFGGFNGFGYNGPSTRNAWVNYIGRADTYQSSYNGQDWKIGMDGVQVGLDLVKTNRSQFGLLFGYEGGNAYNAFDSIKADDTYLGMYGARILRSGADFRFALSYGWQDYDMNRLSVVVPPVPRTFYLSSFEGNTLEANLELGKRVHSGYWSMRPVVGIDLASNEIDGTRERAANNIPGMDGPLAYGDTHLTQIFLRAGSDLRFQKNRFTFNSGLYFAYDVYGADLDAQVTRINAPILSTKLAGSELGKSLLSFNVGGAYQLCNNLSVFGGYQGEALLGGDADSYQSIGHVGGAWSW